MGVGKKAFVNKIIKFRTVVILLILVIVFGIIKPIFLNPMNIMNMLKRMSYTAIPAFGMTFVMVLGGLDISTGSIAAVIGVVMALLLKNGMPIFPAVLICLAVGMVLGLVNGVISVKGKIAPFLVTLATMNIFRGFALVLSAGKPVSIVNQGYINLFGTGMLFGVLYTPIFFLILFFAISWYLFTKTKYGFYIRCIGGNEEAAKVSGIPINKIKIWTYVIMGIFGCVTGLILDAFMSAGLPAIATDTAMDAIAAVVLGGTAITGGIGTLWGTLGGALIMASLNSGMSLLGAQTHVQILVKGVVIILAVLLDNVLKSRETI